MTDNQPFAPLWRRLAALVYDLFILTALSFAYGAIATVGAVMLSGTQPEDYRPMFQSVAFPLGWVAILTLFYCWFWHRSGQTVGMKTWKIRLTANPGDATTQKHVPWSQCLLRCVVATPCVLLAGVGYWYALADPHRRSLQDRLSGTRVVYDAP